MAAKTVQQTRRRKPEAMGPRGNIRTLLAKFEATQKYTQSPAVSAAFLGTTHFCLPGLLLMSLFKGIDAPVQKTRLAVSCFLTGGFGVPSGCLRGHSG